MLEVIVDFDEFDITPREPNRIGVHRSIVRCRDCKHCKPLSNFHSHLGCYNDFLNKHEAIPVCEEGFCAWGERRGDD